MRISKPLKLITIVVIGAGLVLFIVNMFSNYFSFFRGTVKNRENIKILKEPGRIGLHAAFGDFEKIKDLNVNLTRETIYWGGIEPERGEYNWKNFDKIAQKNNEAEIYTVLTVRPLNYSWAMDAKQTGQIDEVGGDAIFKTSSVFPKDTEAFKEFAFKLAERYDADGVDDFGKMRFPINYFQLENEWLTQFAGAPEEYVELLKIFSESIKKANPNAKIVTGGHHSVLLLAARDGFVKESDVSPEDSARLKEALNKLSKETDERINKIRVLFTKGKDYFDVVDYHSHQITEESLPFEIKWLQKELRQAGAENKELISLEFAGVFNDYSEQKLADSVIKLPLLGLSLGMDKIFYSSLYPTENWSENYQRQALLNGKSKKKSAYYFFKTFASEINGNSSVEKIEMPDKNNMLFLVKNSAGGKTWVFWQKNNIGDKNIAVPLNGVAPKSVKVVYPAHNISSEKEFRSENIKVSAGKVNISLNNDAPVFIKEMSERKPFMLKDIEGLIKKTKDKNGGNIGISPADVFNQLKQKADNDIKNNLGKPIREPKAPSESKEMSDRLHDITVTHALLFRLTSEEKYLNRSVDIMKAVSRWKSWAHIGGTSDLDRNSLMSGFGFAYNWLYDDIKPEDKKEIRTALFEKGILPTGEKVSKRQTPYQYPLGHNHFIAGVSALGISSLAIMNDEPKAKNTLDLAIQGAKDFIASAGGADGGYAESISYGHFALSRLFMFRDALFETSGVDLLKYDTRDWIKKFNLFVIYSSFPDASQVVMFNDEASSPAIALQLADCVKYYKGEDIAKKCQLLLKRIYEKNPVNFFKTPISFLDYDPYHPVGSFDDLLKFKEFPDINQAFYHEDWNDPNSLFMAFKAETHNKNFFFTNVAHSHYDGGQFVVYKNGNEYITDLGYRIGACWKASEFCESEVNEFTSKSLGHNNMLFDGKYQDELASEIKESVGDKDMLYLNMDLKNSYSKVNLKNYNREFVFLDNALFVIDSFSAQKPGDIKNYIFRLQLTKRDKDKSDNIIPKYNKTVIAPPDFTIMPYKGNEALYGKILYPFSGADIKENKFTIEEKNGEIKFIEEDGEFLSGKNYLINSFSFGDNKFLIEDKGEYFLISDGSQKIFLSQNGPINIDNKEEKIKFDGRILILEEKKALVIEAKYLSVNGGGLYSSDDYKSSFVER